MILCEEDEYHIHCDDKGRMGFERKFSFAEARDTILRGEWRIFLKDLRDWANGSGDKKEILKRTEPQSAMGCRKV